MRFGFRDIRNLETREWAIIVSPHVLVAGTTYPKSFSSLITLADWDSNGKL